MRQHHRLPFSPDYQFRATKPLTIDGVDYAPGSTLPPGALKPDRLRQLYDLRKVEPIVPTVERSDDQPNRLRKPARAA